VSNFITKYQINLRKVLSFGIAVILMSSVIFLSSPISTINAATIGVSYKCHLEDIGWTDWVADDVECGTTN
jgi:hypothetical protein